MTDLRASEFNIWAKTNWSIVSPGLRNPIANVDRRVRQRGDIGIEVGPVVVWRLLVQQVRRGVRQNCSRRCHSRRNSG